MMIFVYLFLIYTEYRKGDGTMRYEIAWAVSKIICVLILFAITMYAGYSVR